MLKIAQESRINNCDDDILLPMRAYIQLCSLESCKKKKKNPIKTMIAYVFCS